jgi:hypothetical protein
LPDLPLAGDAEQDKQKTVNNGSPQNEFPPGNRQVPHVRLLGRRSLMKKYSDFPQEDKEQKYSMRCITSPPADQPVVDDVAKNGSVKKQMSRSFL